MDTLSLTKEARIYSGEKTCGQGGEGEGGMNGKSVMETYTLPHAKYIASGDLLYV